MKRLWIVVMVLTGCGSKPATLVASQHEALFDTVAGAPTSPDTKFLFTNDGDRATPPLGVMLTGDHGFAITADSCASAALAPHQTCEITVVLGNAVGADLRAELRVYANPDLD